MQTFWVKPDQAKKILGKQKVGKEEVVQGPPRQGKSYDANAVVAGEKLIEFAPDSKSFIRKAIDMQTAIYEGNPPQWEDIRETAANELEEALKSGDTGAGWYDEKITHTRALLMQTFPRLGDDTSWGLFSAILAVTSPNTVVQTNMDTAIKIWTIYQESGSLPVKQPSGKGWPSPLAEGALKRLKGVIDSEGEAGVVQWMNEKVSGRELQKMNPSVREIRKDDLYPRSRAFGPKVGVFYSNLMGSFDDVTVDMWTARSWRRWTNDLKIAKQKKRIGGKLREWEVPNEKVGAMERRNVQALFEGLGEEFGMNVADVQAVLWYYEKRLWESIGATKVSEDIDYETAARRAYENIIGGEVNEGRFEHDVASLSARRSGGARKSLGEGGALAILPASAFRDGSHLEILKKGGKYLARWRGPDGKWRYRYPSDSEGRKKKADEPTYRQQDLPGMSEAEAEKLLKGFRKRAPGDGKEKTIQKPEHLDAILRKSVFCMMSAGRNPKDPEDMKLSEEQIKQRYDKLLADLKARGYVFTRCRGKYENPEESVMVMAHDADRAEMMEIGARYKQDSIVFSDHGRGSLIFTTGPKAGQEDMAGEGYELVPEANDFYTKLPLGDGEVVKFSVNLEDIEKALGHRIPQMSLLKSDSGAWYLYEGGKVTRFYWLGPLQKANSDPKIKTYYSPEEIKAKGMRWVTIRGARVLLQGDGKGGYVVVGGAGGKLNHLKVDQILSKEEYRARQKERLMAMKEGEEKDRLVDSGEYTERERLRRKKKEQKEKRRIKRRKEFREEIKRQYVDKVQEIVKAKTIDEFIGENKAKEIEERVREEMERKYGSKEGKKGEGKGGEGGEFDDSKLKLSIQKKTDEMKRMEATRKTKSLENAAMESLSKDFFSEASGVVHKTVDEEMVGNAAGVDSDTALELMKVKHQMKKMVKDTEKYVRDTGALKVGTVFAGDLDVDLDEIKQEVAESIETAKNIRFYEKITPHQDRIAKYIDNGASRAFNGMLTSIYGGGSVFTEELVRELGVEAVARVVAEKLEKEGKTEKVLKALREYSNTIREKTVDKAMENADIAKDDAARIMGGAQGEDTIYTEAQARAMSIRHHALAYNELGSAAGSLRAMAHVINALEDPPNTKLSVDFGPNEEKAKRRMERAGLVKGKGAKLVRGADKHWHLELNTEKIVPFFEKTEEEIRADQRVDAIKRHEMNDGSQARGMKSKWGFNPATKTFDNDIAASQEAGFRFAQEKDKCLLDFGAGIGKTYVTANLLTDAVDKGAKRILVVVPANLKEQSAEDGYKKFCPDDVAAMVKWADDKMSPEARRAMYAEEGIHVVSHNALQNDAKFLQGQGWDMVVTDEVHQLVNSKESQKDVGMGVQGSASFRSLEKIADAAPRHVAMTGTPIKTDKSEAYKIGKLLGAEEQLGTLQEFTRRYKDVNQSTNAFGAAEVDAMRKSLSSFSYSQSYELEVKKKSNRLSVTSSPEQRREYRRIMEEYKQATDAGKVGASGTRDADLWRASHLTGGRQNAKFRAMADHVRQLPEGEKALAFFSQGPAREGAETYAKQLNEEFGDGFAVHVTSSVSRKKISEYKRAIQGDPEMVKKYPNLRMIVATDTLATGHNLQGAHTVYKIDTPQSKAQDDQQSARSYRNGQTKDVDIVYLEGDDPNDINKRYNFRKKSREAELMGNPESVATKDDSGFGTHLLRAQDESNGEKNELRTAAA